MCLYELQSELHLCLLMRPFTVCFILSVRVSESFDILVCKFIPKFKVKHRKFINKLYTDSLPHFFILSFGVSLFGKTKTKMCCCWMLLFRCFTILIHFSQVHVPVFISLFLFGVFCSRNQRNCFISFDLIESSSRLASFPIFAHFYLTEYMNIVRSLWPLVVPLNLAQWKHFTVNFFFVENICCLDN